MAFQENQAGRQSMPSYGPSGLRSYTVTPSTLVPQTTSQPSSVVPNTSALDSSASASSTPPSTLTDTSPVSSATGVSNESTGPAPSPSASSTSTTLSSLGHASGTAAGVAPEITSATASVTTSATASRKVSSTTGGLASNSRTSSTSSPLPTIVTVSPNDTPAAVPQNKCSGLSCSPGLAAAIFIPIAVAAVVIPLCILLLYRYRKRRGSKLSRTASRDTEMSQSTGSRGGRRTGGLSAALPAFFGAGEPIVPLTFDTTTNTLPPAARHRIDSNQDFGRGFVAPPLPLRASSPHPPSAVPRSSSISAAAPPPPYGSLGDSTMLLSGGPVATPSPVPDPDPDPDPRPDSITSRRALLQTTHDTEDAGNDSDSANPFADPFADPADDDDDVVDEEDSQSIGAHVVQSASSRWQPPSSPRLSRQATDDDLSVVSSTDNDSEVASIREARIAHLSAGVRPVET